MMENQTGINIELNEEVAQGTYSNLAIIAHSSSEFVVDFVRIMPGLPKAKVQSRIILTPEHAKRLVLALQDNVLKYESMHGAIKIDDKQGGAVMPENQTGINIELDEEVSQGIYSNLAIIAHSSSEFVVDFVRIMPGLPKAKVQSRIILTPEHAKRLLLALQDNVLKYELMHGAIKIDDKQGGAMMPVNFGGTNRQA
jgi:allophanate hydrolase subunit 1